MRGTLLVLLGLGAEGCLTGHLLEMARRVEQPLAYRAAFLDGDRLLLDYTALVTDHLGEPRGSRERRAAIACADLERGVAPVETFPVTRLADDAPLRGRRVALRVGDASGPGAAAPPPPFLVVDTRPDGHPTRLILHRGAAADSRPFESAALTRTRTAPWVYPLLPLSLAVDAVTTPALLLFAPAVIVIGD